MRQILRISLRLMKNALYPTFWPKHNTICYNAGAHASSFVYYRVHLWLFNVKAAPEKPRFKVNIHKATGLLLSCCEGDSVVFSDVDQCPCSSDSSIHRFPCVGKPD